MDAPNVVKHAPRVAARAKVLTFYSPKKGEKWEKQANPVDRRDFAH